MNLIELKGKCNEEFVAFFFFHFIHIKSDNFQKMYTNAPSKNGKDIKFK